MECRRFSQTLASEWQTAFVVSHKMPWCALLTAVKNYNKSLEKLQNFFSKTETKTKCSRPRLIFVLEAPRDQDPGLEDYITGGGTPARPILGFPSGTVFCRRTTKFYVVTRGGGACILGSATPPITRERSSRATQFCGFSCICAYVL